MNKISQFALILGILFIGEFLTIRFNIPIPSTILGMIVLFLALVTKIIKLKWVEGIADVLLNNLSILFIPAGVGIIKELDVFKGRIISFSFIILISTLIVIVVTGYTTQTLESRKRGNFK